jgi:molecular chaperone DnaK (HSP70)
MSALACADLLKSARASLASQSDQPAGPSVLPPLSETIYEDFKQSLSKEKFKQTIYDFLKQTIYDFLKHKNLTALS